MFFPPRRSPTAREDWTSLRGRTVTEGGDEGAWREEPVTLRAPASRIERRNLHACGSRRRRTAHGAG